MNVHLLNLTRTNQGRFASLTELERPAVKPIILVSKAELPAFYQAGWRVVDFSGDQVRVVWPWTAPAKQEALL